MIVIGGMVKKCRRWCLVKGVATTDEAVIVGVWLLQIGWCPAGVCAKH